MWGIYSSQIQSQKGNGGCQGVAGGRKGDLLFNRYRVFQDEKISWDSLHNNVDLFNMPELYS